MIFKCFMTIKNYLSRPTVFYFQAMRNQCQNFNDFGLSQAVVGFQPILTYETLPVGFPYLWQFNK